MKKTNKIMIRFKKIYFKVFGKLHNYINVGSYMNHYIKYLKQLGVHFDGTPNYISSDAYFDGHYYGGITIGNKVTISREVMFLVHDYSIVQGLRAIDEFNYKGGVTDTPHLMGRIKVGDNTFIGARCSLLPDTTIGENCIIGSCSVVKGNIPDNSIVIGNPGRVVADTREWAHKKKDGGCIFVKKQYD